MECFSCNNEKSEGLLCTESGCNSWICNECIRRGYDVYNCDHCGELMCVDCATRPLINKDDQSFHEKCSLDYVREHFCYVRDYINALEREIESLKEKSSSKKEENG